ncbi:MAG: RAD55 family ATPase [Candidatus Thorarchaeota archaeon]
MEVIKTGLEGLDKLLMGGIPKGWIIILSGEPGAGKTCLSVGFLVKGIQKGENGIYVSFNESKKELYLTQKAFGYDLQKYEDDGNFRFLDFSYSHALGQGKLELPPSTGTIDLPELILKIREPIKSIDAQRMVIDPLTIISLLFENIREIRYNILRLFEVIGKFGVTTLAIAERPGTANYTVEEFLASGIIRLYNEREGAKRQRGIEVVKMRGMNHKRGIFPFSITGKGIVISPNVELPS